MAACWTLSIARPPDREQEASRGPAPVSLGAQKSKLRFSRYHEGFLTPQLNPYAHAQPPWASLPSAKWV